MAPKPPMRKVIEYTTGGRTSRGNPRVWLFRMECDHVVGMPHGPRASLIGFMVQNKIERKIGCRECAEEGGSHA